jgi:hypothetical protein
MSNEGGLHLLSYRLPFPLLQQPRRVQMFNYSDSAIHSPPA